MTRKEALEYINNMWMSGETHDALEALIPEFGKAGSDNVIDQEDKYKEALLEARAVLEPCLKYSCGKVREALDSIDKELKSFEREDERMIRKIEMFLSAYGADYFSNDEWREIEDWLEKQKELLTPEDKMKHPLYVEGFEAGKQVGAQYEVNLAKKELFKQGEGTYYYVPNNDELTYIDSMPIRMPYAVPEMHTLRPLCYEPGGTCTNPHFDCINCPKKTTGGMFTSPNTATSPNSVSCGTSTPDGNTSVTDGKPNNPSFTD